MYNNKKVYVRLFIPLLKKDYHCLFDARFTLQENMNAFYERMENDFEDSYSSFEKIHIYEPLTDSWLKKDIRIEEMNITNGIYLIVY